MIPQAIGKSISRKEALDLARKIQADADNRRKTYYSEDSRKSVKKDYHDIWAILDFKLRKMIEANKKTVYVDDILKIMKKLEGKTTNH